MLSTIMILSAILLLAILVAVETASGAAICGTEFQPCRTDKEPWETETSLEDCCEGYTCLATSEFAPPVTIEENIWPGVCLGKRSMELALLPVDLKYYMIKNTYATRRETKTHDHKLPHQAEHLALLHMEKGDFPQLIYRMEKKFKISIPTPTEIPPEYYENDEF